MRRFRFLLLSLAGLLLAACILFALAYRYPYRLLIVDSGDVKGNALVLLGGGTIEREERAVELFKAGAAPKILVTGAGDNALTVHLLEKDGVPASDIVREARSTSTLENAEFSIPILRHMGAHRVILVTTWYHSRRALACFEHFAPDVAFYSRPSYFAYSRQEWYRRNVGNCVGIELLKLPGYWIRYGVCPFRL